MAQYTFLLVHCFFFNIPLMAKVKGSLRSLRVNESTMVSCFLSYLSALVTFPYMVTYIIKTLGVLKNVDG